MEYNFKHLVEKQKKLDESIKNKIKIDDEYYWKYRVIALNIELNEFSNEIRFFKYWSKKEMSKKEIVIDELIDCLHFSFSLGITINFKKWNIEINKKRNIEEIYFDISKNILDLNKQKKSDIFEKILFNLVEFIFYLDYDMNDINLAYDKKNKINYERQKNNY